MKNRIKRNVWSIVSVCAFIYVCVNPAVYGAGSPPVAVADSYTDGKEDTPYSCTTVLANDFDPDGEPLSAKLKVNVRHGTLAFEEEDGTFVYTPDPDFNGSDYFSYSAWDGELESSPVKVTIVIKDNHSPQYEDVPIPQDQSVTTPMNTSVEITLFAKGSLMQEVVTDDDYEDDNVAEYQLTGGTPANGTVSWVDFDTLIYTPDDNYVGSDTITFRAKDSDDNWSDDTGVDNDTSGGYADGTVSITVTGDIVIGDCFPSSCTIEQHPLVGDTYYTDRSYTFRYLPEIFKTDRHYLIKTANDDKYLASAASYITLEVNKGVRVYIGYDIRASSTPAWMNVGTDFQDTGIVTGIAGSEGGSSRMKIYYKDYTDRHIVLGGNDGLTTGAHSQYIAIFYHGSNPPDVDDPDPNLATPITANQLPAASISNDADVITAGGAVDFNGSGSSDPDGTISSYAWDFGDGSSTTGSDPAAHTYSEIGVYRAVLTVTDNSGGVSTDAVTIRVNGDAADEVQITGLSPSRCTAERLFRGGQIYTDRTYTAMTLGSYEGMTAVRTANDDKKSTAASLISFTVDRNVTVYVLYDQAASGTVPAWMTNHGFTDTADNVTANAGSFDVYSQTFTAGTIVLGGNHDGGDTGAVLNYVVMVDAAGTDARGTSVEENGWAYANDSDGDGLPDSFENKYDPLDIYLVNSDAPLDTIMDEDEDDGDGHIFFDLWQVEKNRKEVADEVEASGGCMPGTGPGLPAAILVTAAALCCSALVRKRFRS